MGMRARKRGPTTWRVQVPRWFAHLATVWLCVAALGFCAGPALASVVRFAGGPLSEELPTETHTWSETQQRAGARLRVGASSGRSADGCRGCGAIFAESAVVDRRIVNRQRLAHLSGFLPSPATEMIRAGIQLRC